MQGVIYYISLPFIYFLSLLPFPILYRVSDGFYFILYYVFGYRKKIVLQNLRNSFPEKPEKEIKRLCKDYYHYLSDLFLESFKTLTIGRASMLKRCTLSPETKDLFDRF